MVVGSSLLAAIFLPFGLSVHPLLGFIIYVAKVLCIVGTISLLRTVLARLRIDQMINFCWKYMAPVAFLQLLIGLIAKGVITR
jgi:NADH-quinone oxidoreductase subunit H